jgi:hypothetical protein
MNLIELGFVVLIGWSVLSLVCGLAVGGIIDLMGGGD